MSEETKVLNLHQRKAKAMAALQSIPKNGYNSFGNYKYATDGDVLDTFRVLLSQHGIDFCPSMTGREWIPEKNRTIVYIDVLLTNIDDPEDYLVLKAIGEANDKTDKGTVKALTSGVKYFLLKTFLASAGNEADDADSGPEPPARKTVELSTRAQKTKIQALMKTLGYENVDAALTERRYPVLMKLNTEQAKKVIEKLEEKVKADGK
jgi:hypothetical protein